MTTSGFKFDQHLVIAMVVDIARRMGVAAFAEVDLAGIQSQPGDAAGAGDFESATLDWIEKVVVVVTVRLNALAGLQREFPDPNALGLANQLGSYFRHRYHH